MSVAAKKLPRVLEDRADLARRVGENFGGGAGVAPTLSAKRAYLTKKERAAMWLAQDGMCGCKCGRKLRAGKGLTIAEHTSLVALGNGEKPDHIRNKECARRKTYGGRDGDQWTPVGGDIRDAAHIKRIAQKRTQHDRRNERGPKMKSNSQLKSGRKLEGRGFDKSLKRKMSGRVERRV